MEMEIGIQIQVGRKEKQAPLLFLTSVGGLGFTARVRCNAPHRIERLGTVGEGACGEWFSSALYESRILVVVTNIGLFMRCDAYAGTSHGFNDDDRLHFTATVTGQADYHNASSSAPRAAATTVSAREGGLRRAHGARDTDAHSGPHLAVMNVCMVSDFFWPAVGGVETHMYELARQLLRFGHRVCVITHAYGRGRVGVRYLSNGIRVYYLPLYPMARNTTAPVPFASMALLRCILLRERIDVVHGHASGSTLAQECLFHARTMGYATCLTDHSLFEFSSAGDTAIHKVMQLSVSDIGHVICVSHVGKENLVLRTGLNPSKVSVIPNGVSLKQFTPDPQRRPPVGGQGDRVVVVVVSRLVQRKGVELLRRVIPIVCERHPNVDFVVAGDGDKAVDLEEMCEACGLDSRVRLLGAVEHGRVRDVLCGGHIFLNCSLTEAFCMAIVEAASCGLMVVTTNVGGIPEVLPDELVSLCDPTAESLAAGVDAAIAVLPSHDPAHAHARMLGTYSWNDVALRTELVYKGVVADPVPSFGTRLALIANNGPFAGVLFLAMGAASLIYWHILRVLFPAPLIDPAPPLKTMFGMSKKPEGAQADPRSEVLCEEEIR